MSNEYKIGIENLSTFKRQYDKYARELMNFRNQSPIFSEISSLLKNCVCTCARIENISVAAYPRFTSTFGSLILVRCGICGASFVPSIDFNLDKYYELQYQHDVQTFRLRKGSFYSRENTFLSTKTYSNFLKRARLLLDLCDDRPRKSILDFGCGVGILLSRSKAKKKYAVEKDPFSTRILTDELGVEIIDPLKFDKKVDSIILSHVVEHIEITHLVSLLSDLEKILAPSGKMVIAVPDGADQTERLAKGNRDKIRFEPHLYNFSLKAMVDLVTTCGMQVTAASIPVSAQVNSGLYKSLFRNVEPIDSTEIVVVCQKMGSRN